MKISEIKRDFRLFAIQHRVEIVSCLLRDFSKKQVREITGMSQSGMDSLIKRERLVAFKG